MAVVIDEFEATTDPADGAKGGGAPREPKPHETRHRLRQIAVRSLRVRAH